MNLCPFKLALLATPVALGAQAGVVADFTRLAKLPVFTLHRRQQRVFPSPEGKL